MERFGPPDDARNTHHFETERLTVEVPNEADAPVLYGLIGGDDRDEICATLIWDGPDDIAITEEWIAKCQTERFGDFGFHWTIRDRTGSLTGEPGQALGAIGTRPRGAPGRADVGYWLGKPYWGGGVMTEAVTALVAYGRDHLHYAKLEGDVFVGNTASSRLLLKAGFTYEGTIRRGQYKRGHWVDQQLYGIVFTEI